MSKEEKFQGEQKVEKFAQSEKKEKQYIIQFMQNRSYELFVGRKYFPFEPYGKIQVDESIIKHKDFEQQKKYFSIMEIK